MIADKKLTNNTLNKISDMYFFIFNPTSKYAIQSNETTYTQDKATDTI